jgi:hypothetical protein
MKDATFSKRKNTKDRVLTDKNLSPLAKGFYILNLVSTQEFQMTDQIKSVLDELIEFGVVEKEDEGSYIFIAD